MSIFVKHYLIFAKTVLIAASFLNNICKHVEAAAIRNRGLLLIIMGNPELSSSGTLIQTFLPLVLHSAISAFPNYSLPIKINQGFLYLLLTR